MAVRCEMPFSDDGRAVPVVPQDAGERRAVAGQCRRVAREAAGELSDGAEAHRVIVSSGQQRGAGRRTQRGHVEPVVAKTVARRVRLGVWIGPPNVLGFPNPASSIRTSSTLGAPVRRYRVTDQVPVGLRPVQCLPYRPCEGRSANRETAAVDLAHGYRPPSERRWRFSSGRVGEEAPFGTSLRASPGVVSAPGGQRIGAYGCAACHSSSPSDICRAGDDVDQAPRMGRNGIRTVQPNFVQP